MWYLKCVFETKTKNYEVFNLETATRLNEAITMPVLSAQPSAQAAVAVSSTGVRVSFLVKHRPLNYSSVNVFFARSCQ